MALPSSGSISIEQIKTELGITGELSLTDNRVRSLAGLASGSITLPNDLWGKSARSISIYVAGGGQIANPGQGPNGRTYHDRIIFGVQVTGGGTPSSYQWGGDVSGTGSTVQFDGPSYDQFGFTYQATGYVEVSVVIAGTAYSAWLNFSFTAGDQI
jgi:hypothetical protein